MLVDAVTFPTVALAVHILFVVAAFGVVIGYPVIAVAAERVDRRAMPVLHRVRVIMARSLVNPGLLVVVIAGVYLASHLHQWSHFYVQWGIAAVVVIGGLEGSFVIPHERRLAELASRDIQRAGGGEVEWSVDYVAARNRAKLVSWAMALLVAATIVVMTVR
jgi:hypothetical protein